MTGHSHGMKPVASLVPNPSRRHEGLGALILAAVLLIVTLGMGTVAQAQSAPHARVDLRSQHHPKKKHGGKTHGSVTHPCLGGKWDVTSLTLSTTGLTFTGGAGTTVDIMTNGNALGNFTPGAPLTGSEGSAKFNGTITDHYGFSPKTTAHSGSFPVTPVSDNATITVAGVTRPVTSESEQGSYVCTGKDLSLTFIAGGSTLTYKLAPAS